MTKFKVGDKVRVVASVSDSSAQMGNTGVILTVESVHPYHGQQYLADFSESGGDDTWHIFEGALEAVEPEKEHKVPFASVVIDPDKAEQIRAAIAQEQHTKLIFEDWGFSEVFEKGTAISLLFFGIPGTGKTLMAQAIAHELGMDLQIIGTADLESAEPGAFERKVREIFQEATRKNKSKGKKSRKQIILFDECDSLLSNRDRVGVIMGAQINSLLTEIEKFEGVVIFTTNRLGELDPALERRITAKIEFPFPDRKQRKQIWERLIPAKAPIAKNVDFAKLAIFAMPGGNIKNVVLNSARRAAYLGKTEIDKDCFLTAIEEEMKSSAEFSSAIQEVNKHRARPSKVGMSNAEGSLSVDVERNIDKVSNDDLVAQATTKATQKEGSQT